MSQDLFPLAVLAGGMATRLGELARDVPKSMLDVGGEPFIAHQLRLLKSRGARRVVVCAGYLASMIQDYVGDGGAFGLEVLFSLDGPRPLGTGGAVRRALGLLGERFFVMYGDSYLRCDYLAVQQAFVVSGRMALMTVLRNDDRWDRSNVQYGDGMIVAYDKKVRTPAMRHVDYGLGVFRREAFDHVPADEPCDLAEVYAHVLSRGELAAHEVTERFYEIGSVEGLRQTRELLSEGRRK